jgi:predicted permease
MSPHPTTLTLRLYRALARAFPHEFKNVYGEEMLQVAEEAVEPVWKRFGVIGLLRLLLDIALRVPVEYAAELRADVRYGARMLAGSPGFTAVALVSLTLGICIATCAYSEVNGLLRDLPGVSDPANLVSIQRPVSYPDYKQYKALGGLFSDASAYVAPVPFGVFSGRRAERTWGHVVTPSYFSTLRVQPFMGRFFDARDEQPGREPMVVVSFRFWEEHMGSDPAAIGKTLLVNGHACKVIGVGRKEFLGASPALFVADLWLPVSIDPRIAPELADHALDRADLAMFHVLGRLRPGMTEAAAQSQLNVVAQQLAQSRGELGRNQKEQRLPVVDGGKLLPIRKEHVPFFRQFLFILGGLVLLIACANIANMMLARAADRRREIAMRLALGASRPRLIRQLLTESLLVAAAAAPPALVLCYWIMHMASQLRLPLPVPVAFDFTPDKRALVFTFVLTCAIGLAFGLVPALQATHTDLVSALKEGGNVRLRKYRALSLRNMLVLCQMAASLMLLLMTGYLGLGIQGTLSVQKGFDPKNLYLVSIDPVRDGYSPARAPAFFNTVLERVKGLPGVVSACLTDTVPVALDMSPGLRFSTPGQSGEAAAFSARRHLVGRGYFETAGIRILAGRGFERRDEAAGATAVVVSQEAVRQFWKGENAVGRRIEVTNDKATGNIGIMPGTLDFRSTVPGKRTGTFEVVGVVADVTEDLVASKKHPAIYFPLGASSYAQPSLRGVTLMLRAAPGVDVLGAARREVTALDANVSPFGAISMREHITQFMSMLKAASWTYGVMGIFGLILASVGLAGVTAYSVAKRGHEIGIRMALGAQKRDVLALVMKEGAVLVLAGAAIGLFLAWAGIQALSELFFTMATIQGADIGLLVGAPLLLSSLALAACYIPARRSTRIDPAVTLRAE